MGKTSIEWVKDAQGGAGYSWNALRAERKVGGRPRITANHCEHVNEACRYCYAESLNARLGGLPFKPGHRNDYRFFVDEKKLTAPLRMRKPTRIFVESMSDAFGDWWPNEFVMNLYSVMALSPQHTYINLSKRPERRRTFLDRLSKSIEPLEKAAREIGWTLKFEGKGLVPFPLPNVIEGTSVSCQSEADEFVPILLQTKAAVLCVSAEPLLGPIDFTRIPFASGDPRHRQNALTGHAYLYGTGVDGNPDVTVKMTEPRLPRISWTIVGGESGPRARPMHPSWAQSIRDQCAAAGVAFHYKQTGAWAPIEGRPRMVRQGDCFLAADGRSEILGPSLGTELEADGIPLRRVGKKAAGRLLDGAEHNGFPL